MKVFKRLGTMITLAVGGVCLMGATANIQAVHKTEPKAILQSEVIKNLKPGDLMEVERDCILQVGKVAGDRAVVDTRLCPKRLALIQAHKQISVSRSFKPTEQNLLASAEVPVATDAPKVQPVVTGTPRTLRPSVAPTPSITKTSKKQLSRPLKAQPRSRTVTPKAAQKVQSLPQKIAQAPAPNPTPQIIERREVMQPIYIQHPAPAPQTASKIDKKIEAPRVFVSKGFRLGIVKTALDYQTINKDAGENENDVISKGYFDQDIGFSLGYAAIPNSKLGFLGKFSFNEYAAGVESYRAELNATVGAANFIYFYLGVNSNWFSDFDHLDPGIGYETGLGLQFTKNLGLDFGYLKTVNRGKVESATDATVRQDRQFELSGIEASVHGTF